MSIELTVIGCSGSYEGPGEPASSYLVTATDEHGRTRRILVDCGNGALGNLQQVVDPSHIDLIIISHLHADHFLDLAGLEVYLAYHPLVHCPTLPVYAPAGLEDRLSAATGNLDPIPPGASRPAFEFHDLSDGLEFSLGLLEITAIAVDHPVPAFGFRFCKDGKTLAYTGDTDSCEGLDRVADSADLLLCEAGYVEGRDDHFTGIHLTGKRAGVAAREAGAASLVLTHIPPWTDPQVPLAEAAAEFRGDLALARPFDTYSL